MNHSTPIRAVFLDIDGTLVDSQHCIHDKVRSELIRMQDEQISLSLASGRPYFAATSLIDELGILGPCMFSAGSVIVDPVSRESLRNVALEKEDSQSIVQFTQQKGWYTELYSLDGFFIREEHEYADLHSAYLGQAGRIVDLEEIARSREIFKSVHVFDGDTAQQCKAELAEAFPHLGISMAYGAAHPEIAFINLTHPDASRESAFTALISILGVQPEEVLACGDAQADIPFIRLAGVGVAMGNASDEVKQAADYVTGPVEEGGLAEALQKFIP